MRLRMAPRKLQRSRGRTRPTVGLHSLPVSVFSVPDAQYLDGLAAIIKANPVIAEAQPQLGRIDIGKPFHVVFFGCEEARGPVQEIDGGLAVDGANVGTGLVSPRDPLSHNSLGCRALMA